MDPSGYCHRKFCALAPSKPHRRLSSDRLCQMSDHPAQIIFVCFIYFSDSRSGDQPSRSSSSPQTQFSDQALGLLVSTTYIRYRTSSVDLSTSSSLRGLTCFTSGNLLLEVGFTLRCLQRLSLPHFASLLCPWQNNSFTRGASTPVLSY